MSQRRLIDKAFLRGVLESAFLAAFTPADDPGDDILIMRPFDLAPFTKGPNTDYVIMMQHFRNLHIECRVCSDESCAECQAERARRTKHLHDMIDSARIHKESMLCTACKTFKMQCDFDSTLRNDDGNSGVCRLCNDIAVHHQSHFMHDQTQQIHKGKKRPRDEALEADRATRQCVGCGQMLEKSAFTNDRWYKSKLDALLCNSCIKEGKKVKKPKPQTKQCVNCERMLEKSAYTPDRWYKSKPDALFCKSCM